MGKVTIALIIVLLAFVYRGAFTSPFFQDDKLLLETARPEYFFVPVPEGHYHFVSNQLFYFLGKTFFGVNVAGFHFLLFAATSMTVWLIYKLAREFISEQGAQLAVFYYAFNVSLFANLYWVAVSYFVFGALFFFAAVYFFGKKGRWSTLWAAVCYLLAILSNELGIILWGIFPLVCWHFRQWPKRLWVLAGMAGAFLGLKIFWVGFAADSAYRLVIGWPTLVTFRWYLIRALNLPEGVNRATDAVIFVLFALMLALIIIAGRQYLWAQKINWRLFLLSVAWFVLGALPFYFMPGHMSAYYLTIALFAPALMIGELFSRQKVFAMAFIIVYVLLTIRGLDFLAQTHWIILKNTGPIGSF